MWERDGNIIMATVIHKHRSKKAVGMSARTKHLRFLILYLSTHEICEWLGIQRPAHVTVWGWESDGSSSPTHRSTHQLELKMVSSQTSSIPLSDVQAGYHGATVTLVRHDEAGVRCPSCGHDRLTS